MSDYGAQDTSTTTLGANQFPISEAWTPNAGFSAVEGGTQTTDAGGKKSAPVRIEVKDGSDVAQGLTTDAAVTGDNPGTLSAKLRGLSKIWADVWDSVNHRLHVNVDAGSITANAGTNLNTSALALEAGHLANIDTHTPTQGQATKANSSPVVLASDQGDLLIKGDFTEVAGQGTGVVNAANTDFLPITDISAYKWFSVTIAGTWSATLTVQVSNDATFTTFQTLVVQKSDAQIANFLSVSANGTYGQTLGWRYMRVRATAFTSNASLAGIFEFFTTPPSPQVMGVTQLGTWTVQPGNTANTTPWLASDHDGTNKANNLAASSVSNALTNQSARLMAGAVQEISFTTTTVQAVGSTDVSNYRWISVMVGAQGTSSTVTFQASNDNSNWFSCILFGSSAAPSSGASSTTTTGMWHGPLPGRYFRLNVTGISAGTTSGVVELYTVPTTPHTIGASALQNGTWTVQPGNTQNTTPWLMAGPNANGTQAANSAANTVIKGSPGWLYHAIITTLGTAGLTIYDNASTNSGTPLLVIPASAAVGTIYSFPSGARAVNGITSAGVTNCPAVTFHYT